MTQLAFKAARKTSGDAPGQVGFRDIVRGLRDLGLNRNSRVTVHASLSSFGQVAGGAETLVGALMAVCGTVIAPAFTYQTLVTPEEGPPLNGLAYGSSPHNETAEFWRPDMPAHPTLGVAPNTLLRHPAARRTSHPALSFVAVGPDAEEMLAGQTLADPLAPLTWLTDHGGDVLLLGVTHRVNTTVHVGEQRAGRQKFVRWALTPERIEEFNWPGDSAGFEAITDAIKPYVVRGQIGQAHVQRIPAEAVVSAAVQLIRKDPTALLCHNPSCERCRDMRERVKQHV